MDEAELVRLVAMKIAAGIVAQNSALVLDEETGYFDDYDNKAYDCIPIARDVVEFVRGVQR